MNITCGLMMSQDRNLIRLFGAMPRMPSTVTCIVLTDWTNMAEKKKKILFIVIFLLFNFINEL
ncbi:hypothetical protein H8356DRAFT_1683951 [Neocallimastix lanati (nom. inval.)]|nr:hypothetical protein H8356DRAFT_1683951 [Neocallimastix sp. JGI-2020a]